MEDVNVRVSTPESLKSKISTGKAIVKRKYVTCKSAAKKLATANSRLLDAKINRERTANAKTSAKLAAMENQYDAALREYVLFSSLYDSLAEDVLKLYDELIAVESVRGAKKARAESQKFYVKQLAFKDEFTALVRGIDIPDANPSVPEKETEDEVKPDVKEEPVMQNKEEDKRREEIPVQPQYNHHFYAAPSYYMPQFPDYQYRPYPPQPQPQGINVAPVSIDISDIVEDAVEMAMEKFKVAFAKRADKYIAEMEKAEAAAAAESIKEQAAKEEIKANEAAAKEADTAYKTCESILQTEENIAENAKDLIDRLVDLTEKFKDLTNETANLGAGYMQVSNKQKDALELQKKLNDMQRALARELQGVQVNQRVINQDQAEVAEEQAVIAEHQKANAENQKIVTESQTGLADMQKALLNTQSEIEQSMREVLGSQKEIIAVQQSVINGNAKNLELQKDLTARQAEVTELQKNAMAEHKQVSRSQRNINIKYKQRTVAAKKIDKAADASSDGEAIAEDVSLEELI